MPLARYLIFKSLDYYPWGGAKDLYGIGDRLPIGIELASYEWLNALDLQTLETWEYDPETKLWNVYKLEQHEPKHYFTLAKEPQ